MGNVNKAEAQLGWSWLVAGWGMLRRDPVAWAAMGFLFMLIATVLKLIPFIGLLLLVLLAPMLLGGALYVASTAEDRRFRDAAPAAVPLPRRLILELQTAAGRLFYIFADEEKIIHFMAISTLSLGMVVIINILGVLLKIDGSALTAMAAGSVGPRIWVPALIGWFLVLLLQILLLMAVLYVVPLMLFRRDPPLIAIEKSFLACKRNLFALAVFALPFMIANMLISYFFYLLPFPADYMVVFLIGWAAAPLFVTSLYHSYQDVLKK